MADDTEVTPKMRACIRMETVKRMGKDILWAIIAAESIAVVFFTLYWIDHYNTLPPILITIGTYCMMAIMAFYGFLIIVMVVWFLYKWYTVRRYEAEEYCRLHKKGE